MSILNSNQGEGNKPSNATAMVKSLIALPVIELTSSNGQVQVRYILVGIAGITTLFLIAYLGVGILAAHVLSTPISDFSPDKTPALLNLSYQDIRFPARGDDVEIAAWYIPHSSQQRVLILVHGQNDSRTSAFDGQAIEVAAEFNRQGFSVLMLDLRGHGQSGQARLSFGKHERHDIEGAVAWLKTQGFQPSQIGLLGSSMGAAASIGAMADNPDIGALVADSSFAALYPIVQREWGRVSHLPNFMLTPTLLMGRLLFGFDIEATRPVDEIGRITPWPILLIHGGADKRIPVEHVQQLQAAAPFAELWIVPDAEHAQAYEADPSIYLKKVGSFFEQNLK